MPSFLKRAPLLAVVDSGRPGSLRDERDGRAFQHVRCSRWQEELQQKRQLRRC
jgi:hypothetical protein